MNKQEYLRLLRHQSGLLDEQQLNDIESYVSQVFEEKAAKGYSDREIIAMLGNPSKLIFANQKFREDADLKQESDHAEASGSDLPSETFQPAESVQPEFESLVQPNVQNQGKNTNSVLRLLLGLLIGLPILLGLTILVIGGIAAAGFAFFQGLIMTFDLPFRIWQLPFSIREDFSLLVGIGLIMVSGGLLTLFLSSLIGLYYGYSGLIRGNFR